jgi:hypothetical protein
MKMRNRVKHDFYFYLKKEKGIERAGAKTCRRHVQCSEAKQA